MKLIFIKWTIECQSDAGTSLVEELKWSRDGDDPKVDSQAVPDEPEEPDESNHNYYYWSR